MRVVLEMTLSAGGRLEGTASWADQPQPVRFAGVLDLLRLLETVTRARAFNDQHNES